MARGSFALLPRAHCLGSFGSVPHLTCCRALQLSSPTAFYLVCTRNSMRILLKFARFALTCTRFADAHRHWMLQLSTQSGIAVDMPTLSEEDTAKALASAVHAPAAGPLSTNPNGKSNAGGMREFQFLLCIVFDEAWVRGDEGPGRAAARQSCRA